MPTIYCSNGVVRILETGVVYGHSHQTTEKWVPVATRMEEYVKQELVSNSLFVNLYSEVGWIDDTEAQDERRNFYLSAVGQNSLVCGYMGAYKSSNQIAVYFKNKKGNYERLWGTSRFNQKQLPEFLNVHVLSRKLNKIIGNFVLRMGQLTYKTSSKAVAWEIISDEGIFYIPWHNGCIIEKNKDASLLNFEEKTLKEMRQTYCALRFEEFSQGIYRIQVC